MSHTPNPFQTLILWRLLVSREGVFNPDLKPELKAPDRKALENAGLIQVEKRKRPTKKKGARPILFISLSEQGWQWAAENLDAEISTRSPAAPPILRAVLTKLKSHLRQHGLSLADFMSAGEEPEQPPEQEPSEPLEAPAPAPASVAPSAGEAIAQSEPAPALEAAPGSIAAATESSAAPTATAELRQRIDGAYFRLSEGAPNVRVRLAAMREAMPEVAREDFDAALLAMEREQSAVLYPLDNPQEIRPEDIAAAVPNSMGHPRHIIYMER